MSVCKEMNEKKRLLKSIAPVSWIGLPVVPVIVYIGNGRIQQSQRQRSEMSSLQQSKQEAGTFFE